MATNNSDTSGGIHLVLCYKNFAANKNISHIGLGVAALNTAKVLNANSIRTSVFPAVSVADIATMLRGDSSITHVVVSAPWIAAMDWQQLLLGPFPKVRFAVNCHSNVGFLQADTGGVTKIRQYIDLEQGSLNFTVSANSRKGASWVRSAYRAPCAFLANLYYLDYSHKANRPVYSGGTLRLAAFGAQRPLKNMMSAAGAALVVKNELSVPLEFYISSGRAEGGGNTVVSAIQAMLTGIPGVSLVQAGWSSWPQFRDLVRTMHCLLQVSYTESFNMVTADGVAEGVPSVVSDAIDWAPEYWRASVDDTEEIARVCRQLIFDPNAAGDGWFALERHNREGFAAWTHFLGVLVAYGRQPVADGFFVL